MGEVKKVPKLRFAGFIDSWKEKRLDQVSKIGRGKSKHRPRNASFLYGGVYPFIQTGDIREAGLYLTEYSQTYSEDGLKQSKLWDENTLCITIAANIAETTILKIKACFPDSVIGLIPFSKESNVLFIKNQFDKFKIGIQNLSQGVAQDNLNMEKLSKIKFYFPTLPEQEKIANFLTTVDAKISNLSEEKSLLEQYKKGAMQQLFSRELRFKQDDGSDFPEWENKRLGEVAKLQGGWAFKSSQFKKMGIPIIRISNISNDHNYINTNSLVYYSEIENDNNFIIKKGDLIIAMSGATTGKSSIYNLKTSAYLNQRVGLFKSKSKHLKYEFLVQYVFSMSFKIDLDSLLVAGAQPNISSKDIESLNFPFPSINEQTKIANFLSAIDEKIASVSEALEGAQAFKKGLLQQMFV